MINYAFQDVLTGEEVELLFESDRVPRIGDTTEHEGRTYKRLASWGQLAVKPEIRFTSIQLPRNYKYAKHFDDWGSPVFSSKRELDECIAKANAHGEDLAWDV